MTYFSEPTGIRETLGFVALAILGYYALLIFYSQYIARPRWLRERRQTLAEIVRYLGVNGKKLDKIAEDLYYYKGFYFTPDCLAKGRLKISLATNKDRKQLILDVLR